MYCSVIPTVDFLELRHVKQTGIWAVAFEVYTFRKFFPHLFVSVDVLCDQRIELSSNLK